MTNLQWDPTGHLLMTTGASCNILKVWQLGFDNVQLVHSLQHESPVTCTLWCPLENITEKTRLVFAR